MLQDFFKAIPQLNDPIFRRILLRSIFAAIGVFIALVFAAALLLMLFQATDIYWLNIVIGLFGVFAALYIAFLLFPAVVGIVVGFFVEDAAAAVEARHYPNVSGRKVSWMETLGSTLRLVALATILNLLLLPVYVILLF